MERISSQFTDLKKRIYTVDVFSLINNEQPKQL